MIIREDRFQEAKALRIEGYSLNEILAKISISKGTASWWLRDVKLSNKALKIIQER